MLQKINSFSQYIRNNSVRWHAWLSNQHVSVVDVAYWIAREYIESVVKLDTSKTVAEHADNFDASIPEMERLTKVYSELRPTFIIEGLHECEKGFYFDLSVETLGLVQAYVTNGDDIFV